MDNECWPKTPSKVFKARCPKCVAKVKEKSGEEEDETMEYVPLSPPRKQNGKKMNA